MRKRKEDFVQMKCCVSCGELLEYESDEYGTIQEPLCLDCHLDSRKWCETCEAYTPHAETNSHPQSGYCLECYDAWLEENGHIMADIEAYEADLNRQYMQGKLLELEVKL